MMDPRTQYLIHKDREATLTRQIEQKLAAQERGERPQAGQSWYIAAEQWLKETVFSRRSSQDQCCDEGGAA